MTVSALGVSGAGSAARGVSTACAVVGDGADTVRRTACLALFFTDAADFDAVLTDAGLAFAVDDALAFFEDEAVRDFFEVAAALVFFTDLAGWDFTSLAAGAGADSAFAGAFAGAWTCSVLAEALEDLDSGLGAMEAL